MFTRWLCFVQRSIMCWSNIFDLWIRRCFSDGRHGYHMSNRCLRCCVVCNIRCRTHVFDRWSLVHCLEMEPAFCRSQCWAGRTVCATCAPQESSPLSGVSRVAEPDSTTPMKHYIVLSSRSGSRQERRGRRGRRALSSAAVAGRRGACPPLPRLRLVRRNEWHDS